MINYGGWLREENATAAAVPPGGSAKEGGGAAVASGDKQLRGSGNLPIPER